MSSNFVLNDEGDKDNILTIGLLIMALVFTVVDIYFYVAELGLHIGLLITFVVTRAMYKRHFHKRLGTLLNREDK